MPAPSPDRPMTPREWLMLITLSILWGGTFFFYKVLVAELPPLTIVLGRVGIAAVAMNLYLALRRDPMPRSPRLWRQFLAMGLLNNVIPFTLIVVGETRISSGLASILNATTPLFTVLAAHVLTTTERLTTRKAAGLIFGFAGVAVLIGPQVLARLGGSDLAGEACCLAAALVYALASLYGRRFRGIPPLKVATGQVTTSAAVLLPLAALVDRPWAAPAPSPQVWATLVVLALLSTAFAYHLYFRLLATAGATNLVLVTFLLPVSALGLGVLVLGERVTAPALLGMALIGLGLGAIDGRLLRVARRRVARPS